MYRKQQKQQTQRRERTLATMENYNTTLKAIRKYWSENNIAITKIEAVEYPDTGGIRWTATVEVGTTHERMSTIGLALMYVGIHFPGMYNPQPWELRGMSIPTVEVSWWTNMPSKVQ